MTVRAVIPVELVVPTAMTESPTERSLAVALESEMITVDGVMATV